MAWTNPAAHVFAVGEVVSAATMNTYIQANLTDVGSYVAAERYYSFGMVTGGSVTMATVAGSSQTGVATFTEQFTMIVKVSGFFQTANAAALMFLQVWDETGANITFIDTAGQYAYNSQTTANTLWTACPAIGKKQYAANGNAGYSVALSISSGTVTIHAGVEVTFTRGWV